VSWVRSLLRIDADPRWASVKVDQHRLGHASASETLDVYAHVFPDSEQDTRAAIDAARGQRGVRGDRLRAHPQVRGGVADESACTPGSGQSSLNVRFAGIASVVKRSTGGHPVDDRSRSRPRFRRRVSWLCHGSRTDLDRSQAPPGALAAQLDPTAHQPGRPDMLKLARHLLAASALALVVMLGVLTARPPREAPG
jgi:hypothetical protein